MLHCLYKEVMLWASACRAGSLCRWSYLPVQSALHSMVTVRKKIVDKTFLEPWNVFSLHCWFDDLFWKIVFVDLTRSGPYPPCLVPLATLAKRHHKLGSSKIVFPLGENGIFTNVRKLCNALADIFVLSLRYFSFLEFKIAAPVPHLCLDTRSSSKPFLSVYNP